MVEKFFFAIFGFPVSQNVKNTFPEKMWFFDKLIIENFQNELFHKKVEYIRPKKYYYPKRKKPNVMLGRIFRLTFIFFPMTFLSESRKKTNDIGWLRSKPKISFIESLRDVSKCFWTQFESYNEHKNINYDYSRSFNEFYAYYFKECWLQKQNY